MPIVAAVFCAGLPMDAPSVPLVKKPPEKLGVPVPPTVDELFAPKLAVHLEWRDDEKLR